MTLLELLGEIDDKLQIVSGEAIRLQGTKAERALADATQAAFQAKMFAERLQSSLNLIPTDILLSSGNPDVILGCATKNSEQITLAGFDVQTEQSSEP